MEILKKKQIISNQKKKTYFLNLLINQLKIHFKHPTGYIIHAIFMSAWIYPVVAHWVWSSNGWLSIFSPSTRAIFNRGALYFAGSGVVHLFGGSSSIVAAKLVGYRNEFLTDEDRRTAKNAKLYIPRFEWDAKNSVWKVNELAPSDKNVATLGVWILWFGW